MHPSIRARLQTAFSAEVDALLTDIEGTAAHSTTDHRSLVQTLAICVIADSMGSHVPEDDPVVLASEKAVADYIAFHEGVPT